MKPLNVVILAREISSRCPRKNWRPFCGERSLVDICAERMAGMVDPDRVFISSDNPLRAKDAERLGVQFLMREAEFCRPGDYPINCLVKSIAQQLPDTSPVAWCAVTDPLFDQHAALLESWVRLSAGGCDSLGTAYHAPHYLLTSDMKPDGWGYGHDMVPSQAMRPRYWTSFAMQVCQWEVAAQTGFYQGQRHRWFVAHGPSVDINTEDDFRLAQLLYRNRMAIPHGKQPDRYHQSHYV